MEASACLISMSNTAAAFWSPCARCLSNAVFFGHLTLAVAQLATDAKGLVIQLQWQGLRGPVSLSLSAEAVGPEPAGDRAHAGELYFVGPGVRIPLHPLVVYLEDRTERERVGFLNRAVTRKATQGQGAPEEVRQLANTSITIPAISLKSWMCATS